MRSRLRRLGIVICGLVLAFCLVQLVRIGLQYWKAARLTEQAQNQFLTAASQEADGLFSSGLPTVDFTALRAVNADILCWLYVKDTQISYPVLQGADNARYLETAYTGEPSIAGSIFMDARNTPDYTDHNTILYGHNMRDRSMFGSLKQYEDADFAKAHPDIYLLTPTQSLRYQVFSVYHAALRDDCYQTMFDTDADFQAALQDFTNRSLLERGLLSPPNHRILTLSTCTSSDRYRLVVQAYQIDAPAA